MEVGAAPLLHLITHWEKFCSPHPPDFELCWFRGLLPEGGMLLSIKGATIIPLL